MSEKCAAVTVCYTCKATYTLPEEHFSKTLWNQIFPQKDDESLELEHDLAGRWTSMSWWPHFLTTKGVLHTILMVLLLTWLTRNAFVWDRPSVQDLALMKDIGPGNKLLTILITNNTLMPFVLHGYICCAYHLPMCTLFEIIGMFLVSTGQTRGLLNPYFKNPNPNPNPN